LTGSGLFGEALANGCTLGLLYALIAIGYTLVYGILELINFAHGEVLMFGAYYAWAFSTAQDPRTALGLSLFSAGTWGIATATILPGRLGRLRLLAGIGVGALGGGLAFYLARHPRPLILAGLVATGYTSALGIALERICYRPLRNADRLSPLISAIGASLVLSNLAQTDPTAFALPGLGPLGFFGTDRVSYPERPTSIAPIVAIVAIGCMGALTLFLRSTKAGTAMRATAQNPSVASLLGIDPNGVISLAFAIGSALAAVAGILYGLYLGSIHPYMGYMAGIKAFSAAVLGGIGNIPGAMLGGILLGLLESLASIYIHEGYKDVVAFLLLILVLLVRPTGLLGARVPEKV
jgi:branched-chain amino acid transport system permease protein